MEVLALIGAVILLSNGIFLIGCRAVFERKAGPKAGTSNMVSLQKKI